MPPSPQAVDRVYWPPTHPPASAIPRFHPEFRSGVAEVPYDYNNHRLRPDLQHQQHHQQPSPYSPQQQQQYHHHHRSYSVYNNYSPVFPSRPYYGQYNHVWPDPSTLAPTALAQPPPPQSSETGLTSWPKIRARTRGRASSQASSAGNSSAASSNSPCHEGGPGSDVEPGYGASGNPKASASDSYFPPLHSHPVPTDSVVYNGGSGGEAWPEELSVQQNIDDSTGGGGGQRATQFRGNSRHQWQQQQQQQQDSTNGGSRAKRRPNNPLGAGEGRSLKFGKNRSETYVLRLPDEEDEKEELPGGVGEAGQATKAVEDILFTLDDEEYRNIFTALVNHFCEAAYRWLAVYKFKIPRRRNMRDHNRPSDRELTEYVSIIKSLVEGREVPRSAVRDERINELVSIMEGASEIRHVNIHVSRKKKPDRRVLGFIAAVNEFCWVLGDQGGTDKTHQLYLVTEALIMENRRRLQEQAVMQQQQQQKAAAEKQAPPPSPRLPVGEERQGRRKSTSPAQTPERSHYGA